MALADQHWELLVLERKGKVDLGQDPPAMLSAMLKEIEVREAVVDFTIAMESRRIDLLHKDPADRFIAATAKVLGLTLVTQDERLLGSLDFRVLPNRRS
ncbi:MAG: PIN domain-containing protein [Actinomycetota bacterium]